jgi:predicted pyridoxine 5'-phosphate oxidase superfamily flavin-nucleotide-binding protein
VIVTDAVSPAAIVAVVADIVKVSVLATTVDEDGPEDRTPSPSVATTTSAKRLKLSFDIIFLSLVVTKTFFVTAGKEILAL